MILLLLFACTSEPYALGYEDGCTWGQSDAQHCVDFDPDSQVTGSDYARGVTDGYAECYDAWTDAEGCEP